METLSIDHTIRQLNGRDINSQKLAVLVERIILDNYQYAGATLEEAEYESMILQYKGMEAQIEFLNESGLNNEWILNHFDIRPVTIKTH